MSSNTSRRRFRNIWRERIGVDGPADEPTLRTLGPGDTQALPGTAVNGEGGPHSHAEYATDADLTAHTESPHGGDEEHPDLAAHTSLGLAQEHDHDFAASAHSHDTSHDHDASYAGTAHSHDLTAYATDADLATHAATPHGGEGGEHDLATHENLGLVSDSDLTTHAATAHGTQAHAISGVSHTGTLDHSALGSVTANQHHNQDHASRHATGQADALTAANIGAAASGHNHDAAYSASGHTHTLSDGDIPAAIARDAEVTSAIATHAATPHGGESGEAFPVGSVFLSVVSTNPATLLGYGTWAAFGAGRMLLGWNTGDTDEATGGSATHTHAAHSGVLAHTHGVTDPGHVHDEYNNTATTGPNVGWGAQDTSTNNASLTGYDTGSKVTGLTVDSAGSGSEYTHDSPSHLPPYVIVRMWKRTA